MIALLWKEYREKRLWVLMLTAMAAFVIVRGSGYTFVSLDGLGSVLSDRCLLVALIAFILGAGTFSSEIDRSANFLFSQPVSWKKILAAKLLAGLAVLTISAALAAIIYRLLCPEQYARFATVERLGLGVLWAVIMTGIPYLIGVACSTVLPGVAGGMLVGAVVMGLMGLNIALAVHHAQTMGSPKSVMLFSPIGWIAAPIIAMLVTARFGLTLHTRDRIRRYSTIMLGVVGLSLVVCLMHLNPEPLLPWSWFMDSTGHTSIAPGGEYAIIPRDSKHYVFAGPGGKHMAFTLSRLGRTPDFHWPARGTVIAHSPWNNDPLAILMVDSRGKLTKRYLDRPTGLDDNSALIPSPDGTRYILVPVSVKGAYNYHSSSNTASPTVRSVTNPAGYTVEIRDTGPIGILDCSDEPTLKTLAIRPSFIWWQSEDAIGYIENGVRHILPINHLAP